MKRCIQYLFLTVLMLTQTPVYAALELELTQGMSGAIPIAIVPFEGQPQDNSANNVAAVIQNDLKNSGRFNLLSQAEMKQFPNAPSTVDYNYWRGTNVDNVVVGSVKSTGGRYQVSFALLDVLRGSTNQPGSNPVLVQDQFTVSGKDLRRLAHKISDMIYQHLTGEKGIFSTSIAYVLVERYVNQPSKHMLQVADSDGYNPRPMLQSAEPIMSPTWSPDGRRIAYVSFENRRANIYLQDVASGKRSLLSSFPGINGAPAWSPDGSKLALVLSKDGAPNVYTFDLSTSQLRQLTNDLNIDTEPSWAPDGQSILFTSNRGGGPQVYQLFLGSGKIQRLSFDGKYNASGSFTADGKNVVLLHGEGNRYNVAVQDISSGALSLLTHSGNATSPRVAPNGRMVLYATSDGSQGELAMVSIDGKVRLRLPAPSGIVQAPSWSPFLN